VNRFFFNWTEDQQQVIDLARSLGGYDFVKDILDRVSRLKVAVVGEPIVDTYVFCHPESISSKSPSISARYLYQESYAGGSLAVANHLSDFVEDLSLYFTHGNEDYFNELVESKIDSRIRVKAYAIPNVPTPRKTRYIAVDKSQRIFELTDIRSDQWSNHDPKPFMKVLADGNCDRDATILCDFGHGLFEGEVLNACSELKGFVALNAQTNSSNYGFNPFTKHKRFDYLGIDTREARLAYHDRFSSPSDLFTQISKDCSRTDAKVAMTLGPNGSYYCPSPKEGTLFSPTFTDSVLDATGAGDAFFALSAVLIRAECPAALVPFLANIFAGLKTKIIGNKSAVSKSQFLKAVTAILK
jgi:bifunctional ADP-heptose synthase (sugar kinase/adenylyltransferase)